MDKNALVTIAIEKVHFPDKYREGLLRPLVLPAMLEMVDALSRIDTSAQHNLLINISSQLVELLDQRFLLTCLSKYFARQNHLDRPYSQLMADLLASAGSYENAFNMIVQGNISFQQAILLEITTFIANINLLAQRIYDDLDVFGQDFAQCWSTKINAPRGVLHISIVGRFAFNGGKRVAIITLDNQQRIVYKPRDIRIEAALVGHIGMRADNLDTVVSDLGRSCFEVVNSLLSEHLGEDYIALPTYQFLPRQDAHGRYGFIEYLSGGTPADVCLTHAEAQKLYRQLGQLTALSLILGIYDLIPANIRISGKQAFLTDVDIAFDSAILKRFLREISNVDVISSPPASIKKSLLANFWEHSLNNLKPMTLFEVKNDKLQRNSKITIPKNNLKEIALENLIVVLDKGSNRNFNRRQSPVNVHSYYAVDVQQGLEDIFSLIQNHTTAKPRMKKFISNLAGLQVRYFSHVLLAKLIQDVYCEYLYQYPEPQQLFAQLNREINKLLQQKYPQGLVPNIDLTLLDLQSAIFSSISMGNYLYLTQKLAFYSMDGQNNTTLSAVDSQKVASNPAPMSGLELSLAIIDKLAVQSSQPCQELFITNYVAFIREVPLPNPPPRYAVEKFVASIGKELAIQLGCV